MATVNGSAPRSTEDRWLVVRRGRFSIAANLAGERKRCPSSVPVQYSSLRPTTGVKRLEGRPDEASRRGPASVPARSVAVVAIDARSGAVTAEQVGGFGPSTPCEWPDWDRDRRLGGQREAAVDGLVTWCVARAYSSAG